MKQTAVEKIISEIDNEVDFLKMTHGGAEIKGRMIGLAFAKRVALESKAMEKERIIYAQMDMFHFLNNLKFGMMYLEKREEAEKFAEQWYNETYGDKNE